MRLLALGAQATCQTLGRNQDDAGGDVERCYPHVAQTRQRGGGIVGVQGREHHVAGLCGLDGDVCSFQVTDFTDHDHVRVLTQKRLERSSKGQARLVIDVDLVDPRHVDFGRVFSGRDVDAWLIEDVQAGVERHRLARAGGAGHQNHAVGTMDGIEQACFFFGLIAQGINAHLGAVGVQDTDDDFFAKQRGQGGHTEVNHPFRADLELHAAILWHAFFRNVQT